MLSKEEKAELSTKIQALREEVACLPPEEMDQLVKAFNTGDETGCIEKIIKLNRQIKEVKAVVMALPPEERDQIAKKIPLTDDELDYIQGGVALTFIEPFFAVAVAVVAGAVAAVTAVVAVNQITAINVAAVTDVTTVTEDDTQDPQKTIPSPSKYNPPVPPTKRL